MNIKREKLINGSILTTVRTPNSQSVTFAIIIKSGPFFDPKNKTGLSHFIEHLICKGSKKYSNINTTNNLLEKKGIITGAFSYQETNLYWAKGKQEDLSLIINILTEQLQNPLLNNKNILLEKEVVKEELNILNNNPNSLIWELWAKNIWQGTPLGRSYIGDIDSINNFFQKDVIEFINNNYLINNTKFIITGNITKSPVINLLNSTLTNYSNNKKQNIKQINIKRENPVNIYFQKNSSLTVAYGFLTTNISHKESIILELIGTLLGGGWGSLLRKSVFQKGLTYSIETYTKYLTSTGYSMNLFTCEKNNLNKIIESINNQLNIVMYGKFQTDDIERAKGFLTSSIIFDNEKSDEIANWFAYQEILDFKNLISPQEKCKTINSITNKEIMNISKKYFTNKNWHLSIIGEIKSNEIDQTKINSDLSIL